MGLTQRWHICKERINQPIFPMHMQNSFNCMSSISLTICTSQFFIHNFLQKDRKNTHKAVKKWEGCRSDPSRQSHLLLLNSGSSRATSNWPSVVILENSKRSSYGNVNHSSCRSSFAVGLFLGSSFIILQMNSLSSLVNSGSSAIEKGFCFSFS